MIDKLNYTKADGQKVELKTEDCPADVHNWLTDEHAKAMHWLIDLVLLQETSDQAAAMSAIDALTIMTAWGVAMHDQFHELQTDLANAKRRIETLEWMVK